MFKILIEDFPKITFSSLGPFNEFTGNLLCTNVVYTVFVQIGKHSVVYGGGGGGGGFVGICEICEEPWVPFRGKIANLIEGRFRINKLNVPFEMKI